MATKKITALTNSDTILDTDILPFVSDPSGTPITKKVSVEKLFVGRSANNDFGVNVVIGDGVNAVTTGIKGYIEIPYNCVIESVSLISDIVGSIVIDIWKDTYTNFPPTVADTITASAKPTLSSAQKSKDTTLTGWNKTLTKGDWLAFKVDSTSTVNQVTLCIKGKKVVI